MILTYKIDETYDGTLDAPVTIKRLMVMEMVQETTEDELDDILRVLIPGPDDAERRAKLIEAVYRVWVDRKDCHGRPLEWEDVVQMFQDIQCLVGVPYEPPKERRLQKPRPSKKSASVLKLIPPVDKLAPNGEAGPTQSDPQPG
jgi:hypothetical protein